MEGTTVRPLAVPAATVAVAGIATRVATAEAAASAEVRKSSFNPGADRLRYRASWPSLNPTHRGLVSPPQAASEATSTATTATAGTTATLGAWTGGATSRGGAEPAQRKPHVNLSQTITTFPLRSLTWDTVHNQPRFFLPFASQTKRKRSTWPKKKRGKVTSTCKKKNNNKKTHWRMQSRAPQERARLQTRTVWQQTWTFSLFKNIFLFFFQRKKKQNSHPRIKRMFMYCAFGIKKKKPTTNGTSGGSSFRQMDTAESSFWFQLICVLGLQNKIRKKKKKGRRIKQAWT